LGKNAGHFVGNFATQAIRLNEIYRRKKTRLPENIRPSVVGLHFQLIDGVIQRNFFERGGTFGERLACAWSDVGGPGLQIGMDTPQVSAGLLESCLALLLEGPHRAALGPADDGGWWALGLRSAEPRVFDGVPMSTARTAWLQGARLAELGLTTAALPGLRDVDTIVDAIAVAATVPASGFAAALRHSLRQPA